MQALLSKGGGVRYGGDRYGSLLEYLVLDRFFDLIRPDLMLDLKIFPENDGNLILE